VEYQRMTFAVSMPVRIALLGCGAIGEVVAQRVYATAKATGYQSSRLSTGCRERAEAIAELLGVPAFSSLKVACANAEVDAVDIRLPHDQHAPPCLGIGGRLPCPGRESRWRPPSPTAARSSPPRRDRT